MRPRTIAFVMAGLAVVLTLLLIRVFAPSFSLSLATPLWNAGTLATKGTGTVSGWFADKEVLLEERDRLLRENAALTEQNLALTAKEVDLMRLMGTRTGPLPTILAGVLIRPPVSPYDVLVVDQGQDAGVRVGAQAMGEGGVPLGVVESVTATQARILLYSAPGHTTHGWIGEERLPVTLTGRGAGTYDAEVPREATVTLGTLVYLPGPGAIPVGSVVDVETDPSSPRASIRVRPYTNPFSVTWVEISR